MTSDGPTARVQQMGAPLPIGAIGGNLAWGIVDAGFAMVGIGAPLVAITIALGG